MIHYPPKGLMIALITPLEEKGGVDWTSLRRLIDRVLPYGDGLLVGEGRVGEGLSLPNEVRLQLLQGAAEAVAGKRPLLLCPTASTAEETLNNISVLSQSLETYPGKESLFWLDFPLWYHSNRKLPQFYQEWSRRTSFPILLYNNPRLIVQLNRSLKRPNLRTAVLKRLAENEQIVGLIQAGDLNRTIHYERAVRARRDFRFYDGDEGNFLNGPSSSGVVSGGANLLPSEWSEIVTGSLKISEDPARNLLLLKQSQKLRELNRALHRNPALSLKVALHRLGLIARAKVQDISQVGSLEEAPEMGEFLHSNFSLQNPP